MVSEQPSRKMVGRFQEAGWSPVRTVGSHTVWRCGCGRHQFTLPDGHRTISPGVVAKADRILTACMRGK